MSDKKSVKKLIKGTSKLSKKQRVEVLKLTEKLLVEEEKENKKK